MYSQVGLAQKLRTIIIIIIIIIMNPTFPMNYVPAF